MTNDDHEDRSNPLKQTQSQSKTKSENRANFKRIATKNRNQAKDSNSKLSTATESKPRRWAS